MRLILSIVFERIIEHNFSCVKLPGRNSGFLIMQSGYLVKYKQLTALRRHSMWNRPNKSDSPQKWAQLDTVLNWGLESPQNPQAGRRRAGAALWRAAKAERPALREPIAKLRSSRGNEAHFSWESEPPHVGCYSFERTSRSADIPVRGFGRLSSRPALPAQTFRPRTVSKACCPNCRAGFRACRLRSFPTSRTKADSLTRNPGTGKSPEPADRNVCPTSEPESDLGNSPLRCTPQKSPL
jgi:hypothetical protein